jgi:hypothetical protein
VPYVIQKAIEKSQIYIVILGFRYGAMANPSVVTPKAAMQGHFKTGHMTAART